METAMASESKKDGAAVKTLAKGLAVLDLLINEGMIRPGDVAMRLGIDRGGTSRLLQTLVAAGYAERSGGRAYRAGPRILALRAVGRNSVRRLARPALEALSRQTGECTYLGVPADGLVLYIDKVDIAAPLKVDHPVGTLAPIHRTALGKVLLAYGCATLPDDIDLDAEACARLHTELEQVVATGFAVDNEERAQGVRCVAAPFRDDSGQVVAAIAVAGPTLRIPAERIAELGETLRVATNHPLSA